MNASKAVIRAWTRTQSRAGRKRAAPVVLLNLLGCLAALFQAWCIARILAAALSGSQAASLAKPLAGASASSVRGCAGLLGGFAAAALARAALQAAAEMLSARAGRISRSRLRGDTLGRMLSNGPALLRGTHSGALAAIVVDRIEAVDGFFARYLPSATLALALPALILVACLVAQPFAAVVLLCCGIAVPLMQALFGIGAAAAARRQFEAMSRLQTRFVDRMRGIATIVLAGRAEDEALHLAQAADELRIRTMRVLRVAFLSSAGLDCAMAVALVVIAVRDGRLLLHAGAGQAGLLARALFALLLVPEFFAPLRAFALAYQDRMQASACAESLAILPEPGSPGHAAAAATGRSPTVPRSVALAFEDVGFAWDAARGAALDGVSFRIAAGETMLLVGPSGSGKSTIIEMLLGFIRPDHGRVTIDGVDLHELDPATLGGLMTWIGQKPVLFAGTLRENVLFARPDADAAALGEALRVSALEPLLETLPKGLDTLIGEGGYGLSGGQAQRVAIARAVLRNAPLLLLDEPTAHLDPETERAVFESLRQLARNRTVLLASHATAAQGLGGRRLDIGNGRIGALPAAADEAVA